MWSGGGARASEERCNLSELRKPPTDVLALVSSLLLLLLLLSFNGRVKKHGKRWRNLVTFPDGMERAHLYSTLAASSRSFGGRYITVSPDF